MCAEQNVWDKPVSKKNTKTNALPKYQLCSKYVACNDRDRHRPHETVQEKNVHERMYVQVAFWISNHFSSAGKTLRTSNHLFPCQNACFMCWCSKWCVSWCLMFYPDLDFCDVLSVCVCVPVQLENVWYSKCLSTHINWSNYSYNHHKSRLIN